MRIRKRTGELQTFDVSKIEQAIYKAFKETYGEERANDLFTKIQEMAKSVIVYDGIGIEEIQNKVQYVIKEYPEALEHYILRRNARAKRRESLKNVVYSSEYLAPSFLINYDSYPAHMNPVSKFTYLRTYSRDVIELGRRETFKETILRATDHNINMDTREREEKVMQFLKKEAEQLFDMQFNLRAFLSGRAMFTGGSNASSVYPLNLAA
jgi:hypothetical protein